MPDGAHEKPSKWSSDFWADWAERVGATFLQVAIPLVPTAEMVDGFDWTHSALVIGLATLLSAMKGLLANMKNPNSGASALPTPPGPEVIDVGDERGEAAVAYFTKKNQP